MSSPLQLTPLLSLFADEGDFTLRLDDSPLGRKLGPEIIRLLSGSGGRRLTILTPTDTKIFKLGGPANGHNPLPPPRVVNEDHDDRSVAHSANSEERTDALSAGSEPTPQHQQRLSPRQRIQQDQSAPPSPELAEEDAELARLRAEEREAERLRREMEAANRADPQLPPEPTEEDEPPAPRVRRRASRPEPSTSAQTPCGRCYGAGQLDGGGVCPVCQGRQTVQLYGRRR